MIVFGEKFETVLTQQVHKTHAILLHGTATDGIRRTAQKAINIVLGTPRDNDRLTELGTSDIRQDPAIFDEAIRARSFFPGRRVVHVSQATDSLAGIILPCLHDMQTDDALLIISAGKLPKTSKIRKAFEGSGPFISTPLYEDNLSHIDIQRQLRQINLTPESDIQIASRELAQFTAFQVDQFIQILELAALDGKPVVLETYLPAQTDVDFHEVIRPLLRRNLKEALGNFDVLVQRRQSLVTLVILLSSEIHGLLKLRLLPDAQAQQKLRTMYFGPRQKVMQAALPLWHEGQLTKALQIMHALDLHLRSTTPVDPNSFTARQLVKLCKL